MKEFYRFHNKDEYSRVKKIVFSYSAIEDAVKVVHLAIEDEIASYLNKVSTGEYKNVALQDTMEIEVISLYTRAKTALLNRKIVGKKSIKTKVLTPEEDIIKEFEKTLYKPEEDMKFPND